MFEKTDQDPATFSERRALAASEEGRKTLLMDFIAVLHGKVMEGEMSDSNMLRAIQTAEKLHRTLTEPAIAPEPAEQPGEAEEEDPYAYDHTNMHRQLAEMSDEDLLSHVEGLVGVVEHKQRRNPSKPRNADRMWSGALSLDGETISAPTRQHSRSP